MPEPEHIRRAAEHFREILQLRYSSPLFRLGSAEEVIERLAFHNTGPEQIPGLVVMSLSDKVGENLDPEHASIVVLFNALGEEVSFTEASLAGLAFILHPVLANSSDPIVRESSFDADSGTFTVPARTTAVFVELNR